VVRERVAAVTTDVGFLAQVCVYVLVQTGSDFEHVLTEPALVPVRALLRLEVYLLKVFLNV
jgi:hypothetical protein